MKLFLLRHGSAHPQARKDSERELTVAGQTEIKTVLEGVGQNLGVTRVLASPYVRAQQTVTLALSILGLTIKPETSELITPGGNPQAFLDYLQANYGDSNHVVLCVSHQPFLGTLLDDICGFEPGQYRMGTGAFACIEFNSIIAKGLGELLWLKQP